MEGTIRQTLTIRKGNVTDEESVNLVVRLIADTISR